MTLLQGRRLGPEPWGDKMRRARHLAGFEVRQVEDILFPHISKSSLIRLEANHPEVPADRKDRARAALVVILYGFALEDFGLSADDVPPAMDYEVLQRLRDQPSTGWLIVPHRLAAAA
jgi:hypothetical protein